jgi:hypothetical protein
VLRLLQHPLVRIVTDFVRIFSKVAILLQKNFAVTSAGTPLLRLPRLVVAA